MEPAEHAHVAVDTSHRRTEYDIIIYHTQYARALLC